MMKTSKPNYKRAEKAAHDLILSYGINKLPVKVKRIAKKFSNLKLVKYSQFAKKQNMTIEEVYDFADSEEGCCWYTKSTNRYIILYNDTRDNVGRIRWTIAHELGHFILKHNELNDKTILTRGSLTKQEYNVYESEANCFARALLAPSSVLTSLGYVTIFDISHICNISFQAAQNVINFLKTGQEMGRGKSINIVKAFSNFIFKVTNSHHCNNCSATFTLEKPFFCPYCGSDKLSKLPLTFTGDEGMKYKGFEVDPIFGRAASCPKCKNEEVTGEYCKICGTFVVNKCTGFPPDKINQPFTGKWHQDLDNSCGTVLSGDARFCDRCGSTSTFYEQALLESWEQEQNTNHNQRRNNLLLIESQQIDISDEDLPF
ncbi:ImmA/IrrE family metallo-endopeptidase [Pullulanibacillus sp. KACC 23026]|uniref:ImmA/IrrE family metallo-endopeptidase n=1 Tax=Pullulanibacillus sp. KACC 23026 TaxID=3028315 RepID=UPI0023B1D353|nr:ImmA/IrrE family metallo-endopeptidase [Pullulanibacillus sp. KACC 23026]WEG14113.1 ImmA/IrrE family metallo-endopeptidase [Pullulanibacillus sp. KACC 23026]